MGRENLYNFRTLLMVVSKTKLHSGLVYTTEREEEVMFFEREYEQWKRRDKERGMREEDVFS
jgi:hypothetical protein